MGNDKQSKFLSINNSAFFETIFNLGIFTPNIPLIPNSQVLEACLEADEEVQVARPVATPQHGSKASPGAEEAMSEDDLTLALASAFQKQMGGTGLDDEITDPYCQNDEWCKETMVDSPDSFQMDQRFLQQDRCPDSGSSYFAGHVAESPGINGQPEVPDVVSTSTVGTQERQPL